MTLWSGYDADTECMCACAPTMSNSNAWTRISSMDGAGKCLSPFCRSDPTLGAHYWEGGISPTKGRRPGCGSRTHLAAMPHELMAAGLVSEEISACWSTVSISSLEALTTLMLESLSRPDYHGITELLRLEKTTGSNRY